jgi:hypothetical protein
MSSDDEGGSMAGADEMPDERPEGAADEIADAMVDAIDWHLLLFER